MKKKMLCVAGFIVLLTNIYAELVDQQMICKGQYYINALYKNKSMDKDEAYLNTIVSIMHYILASYRLKKNVSKYQTVSPMEFNSTIWSRSFDKIVENRTGFKGTIRKSRAS